MIREPCTKCGSHVKMRTQLEGLCYFCMLDKNDKKAERPFQVGSKYAG